MICIYHNKDLDGFASAAIVKRKYPNAVLIGHDYKDSYDQLEKEIMSNKGHDHIIMIDVSLPMMQMLRLAHDLGFGLTWIDHHISAIAWTYILKSMMWWRKMVALLQGRNSVATSLITTGYCFVPCMEK